MTHNEKVEAFFLAKKAGIEPLIIETATMVVSSNKFQNRIQGYVKRMYDTYGNTQLKKVYSYTSMQEAEIYLTDYIFDSMISKYKCESQKNKKEPVASFYAWCSLVQKEAYVQWFLNKAKESFPELTHWYLQMYVKIRKKGVEIEEGVSNAEISEKCGISEITIDQLKRIFGFTTENYHPTKQEREQKAVKKYRFYYNGKGYNTLKAISELVHVNNDALSRLYRKCGNVDQAVTIILARPKYIGLNGEEYKNGESMCKAYGITYNLYHTRRYRGYSHEEALQPARK